MGSRAARKLSRLRIYHINANRGHWDDLEKQVEQYWHQYDIFAFSEANYYDLHIGVVDRDFGFLAQSRSLFWRVNVYGVTLLVKREPVHWDQHQKEYHSQDRIAVLSFKHFHVVAVYAPHAAHSLAKHESFYSSLRTVMRRLCAKPVICVGDWNAGLGMHSLGTGSLAPSVDSLNSDFFQEFVQEHCLCLAETYGSKHGSAAASDWRVAHAECNGYLVSGLPFCYSIKGNQVGAKPQSLDHFLVPRRFLPFVAPAFHGSTEDGFDHRPTIAEFPVPRFYSPRAMRVRRQRSGVVLSSAKLDSTHRRLMWNAVTNASPVNAVISGWAAFFAQADVSCESATAFWKGLSLIETSVARDFSPMTAQQVAHRIAGERADENVLVFVFVLVFFRLFGHFNRIL